MPPDNRFISPPGALRFTGEYAIVTEEDTQRAEQTFNEIARQLNLKEEKIMTNKNPIRISVYGLGIPKVDFAFTGDPPFIVFNLTRRYDYYRRKENTIVYNFDYNNDEYSHVGLADELKAFIKSITNEFKSGTIIVDRMTDLIRYVESHGEPLYLIDAFKNSLFSTNLDVVMLFGEQDKWDYKTNQPTGIKIPDFPRDFYHIFDFIVHAPKDGELNLIKMTPEYQDIPNPTISYLKTQRGLS
jgi:hypothetical protein